MANQYDTNLKLQAIADAIGDSQSSGLIQALEDIADAVAGGGGGGSSAAGLVSDNFSETDTYDLGDYCIHNNTLYVCINAITTPGTWDLSDWQATNSGIELSSLNSALTDIEDISSQLSYDHTLIPTLWGLSAKVKNGVCYLFMSYAVFNAAGNNLTLVTGLPKAAQQISAIMSGADAAQTGIIASSGSSVWISAGGTALQAHVGTDYGRAHWISIAYPIDES